MKRSAIRAACAALAAGALCLLASFPAGAADDAADVNPRYVLSDTKGRTVTNEDFRGRFQLITFGYTFCPDVCPTTLTAMAQILRGLGERAARLQPIFITVDPERDTAEALARYTAYFDKRIIGLTGSPELIRAAADHYKVTYRKHLEPGAKPDSYSIDHTAGMFLLGPDGMFAARFAHSATPQETAARIAAIMAGRRGAN